MTVDSLLVDGTRMLCTSVYNGPSTTGLRVQAPTGAQDGQPHRYVYFLPVKPDDSVEFGDGFSLAVTFNLHNLYNATLIAPEFHKEPWLADHPSNADLRYETFMTTDLRNWAIANLAGGGEHWLISFSKGGWSALSLMTRNPTKFDHAAVFDSVYSKANVLSSQDIGENWTSGAIGSEANYDANYDLPTLLAGRKAPFVAERRISSAGAFTFTADETALFAEFDSEGIQYFEAEAGSAHDWDAGWLYRTFEALHQFYVVESGLELPSGIKVMLHNDGVDTTNFIFNGLPTLLEATPAGNVQIDTAQKKFGLSSVLFDGTGDYLDLGGAAGYSLGTGDFVIDWWVRWASAGTHVLLDFEPNHIGGPLIYLTAADVVFYANSATRIARGSALSVNTWYHLAFVRSAGVTRGFLDGVQFGVSYTDANNYAVGTTGPRVGAHLGDGSLGFNGWMDEIRITTEAAEVTRMFNGFSVPTEAYAGEALLVLSTNALSGLSGMTGGGEMDGL